MVFDTELFLAERGYNDWAKIKGGRKKAGKAGDCGECESQLHGQSRMAPVMIAELVIGSTSIGGTEKRDSCLRKRSRGNPGARKPITLNFMQRGVLPPAVLPRTLSSQKFTQAVRFGTGGNSDANWRKLSTPIFL